jgi:ParB family chromosome partitioning protein
MQTTLTDINAINVRAPFSSLFPMGSDTLDSIKTDMASNGFDDVFPIIVWKEENTIVDGHTRYTAAMAMELSEVPVLFKSFENEDDALLYSFHVQRNRRNLADEDIIHCLEVLDKLSESTQTRDGEEGESLTRKELSKIRAKELGTSASKIEKAQKVLEHGDEELKESVNSGEKSINKAFQEMQEMRRESGELKGKATTGLASAGRYTKALGKLIEEINRIKEDGWEELSPEKILMDLDSVKAMVD